MAQISFNLNDGNEFVFEIDEAFMTLGRDPKNSIVINNSYISSFHAEFRRVEGSEDYELTDLGSFNGIAIAGNKIEKAILKDGDKIAFGQLEARYRSKTVLPELSETPKKEPEGKKDERMIGINGATMRIPVPPAEASRRESSEYRVAATKLEEIEIKLNERAERLLELEDAINKLGGDKAFAAAQQSLSADAAAKDFRARLSESDEIQKKLESQNRELRSEIATLGTAVKTTREEGSKVSDEISAKLADTEKQLAEKSDALTKERDELRAELDGSKKASDEATKRAEDLQKQLDQARDDASKSTDEVQAKFADTEKQLAEKSDALTKERDDLRAELDGSKKASEEAMAKLGEAETKLADSAKELDSSKGEFSGQLEEALLRIQTLQDKRAETERVSSERGDQIGSLKADLATAQGEAERLRSKLTDAQKAGAHSEDLSRLESQLADRKKDLDAIQIEEGKLEALKSEQSEIESKQRDQRRDLDEISAKSARLDAEISTKETKAQELSDLETKVREAEDKLKSAKTEFDKVQLSLETRNREEEGIRSFIALRRQERDKISEEVAAADNKREAIFSEIQKLQQDEESLKGVRSEIAAAQQNLESLREENRMLEQSTSRLTSEIATYQSDRDRLRAETNEYQNDLQSMRDSVERAEGTIGEGLKAKNELAELTRSFETKKVESLSIENKLRSLEEQCAAVGVKIKDAESRREAAEQEARTRELELERLEAKITECQGAESRLEALLSDEAQRKQSVRDLEGQLASLANRRKEVDDLEAHNAALQKDRGAKEEKLRLLAQDRDELEDQIVHLETQLTRADSIKDEIAASTRKLDELKSTISENQGILDQIRGAEGRLTGIQDGVRTHLEEKESLLAEIVQIQQRQGRLSSEVKELEAQKLQIRDAESESVEIVQQVETLKAEVEHFENRRAAMQITEDLEAATVQVMSQDVMKRIDLVDTLISRFAKGDQEIVSQLSLLRQSLVDMLRLYDITEYEIPVGANVDLQTRHRIRVIEVQGGDNSDGDRKILETLRAGFISSPANGEPVILRKAEVILTGS